MSSLPMNLQHVDHSQANWEPLAEGRWTPCGSRITCSVFDENTDYDFLVDASGLIDEDFAKLFNDLIYMEFIWEGSEHYRSSFNVFSSMRRREVNLIISRDKEFVKRHKTATEICRTLDILDKSKRIEIFQLILYGVTSDGRTI